MPDTDRHPSDLAIKAFALGTGSDAAVEEHLAGCDTCQQRAEAVAPDTIVELLAAAHTRVVAGPTPAPDAAATPPAFAPTLAWGGPIALDVTAPAELAGHPKYRVVRRLGVGGMGTVWLAEHAVMNRSVAVKVIRPDLLARGGAADRFLREVRAAAKLHHPNIVTAFDAEPAGDSWLLAMEYVPGETLADRVQAGPLPVAEACRAVRDAARGLAHAHAAGLVHRDVKPHNLIRATDGTTKVLDFGLTGVAAGEEVPASGERLTGAGMVVGTPDYIAPEQIADPRTADARADVYGLGCTLYHLLAGRPPMPGATVAEKLAAQQSHPAAPVPGLPAGLNAVLAKMLAKRPQDRFQSADEVAAALEPFAYPGRRRGSRRRAVVALLAAAAVLLLGVVVVATSEGRLVIDAGDDDIQVAVMKGGREVEVLDLKTGSKVKRLPSGDYEIKLKGDRTDVKLDRNGFTMTRWGRVVVRVTRVLPGEGQEAKIAAASAAADAFFKALDAGDYDRVWGQVAAWAKQQGPNKDEVIRVYELLKHQSGSLKGTRMPTKPEFKTSLPNTGAPEGEYVVFGYSSRFERWDHAAEQLVLKLEPDGQWRAVGYHRLAASAPPAEAQDGWVQLFNGKDLTGWSVPTGYHSRWKVEQGVLVSPPGPGKWHGLLVTDRNDFADFHLRVEAKFARYQGFCTVIVRGDRLATQKSGYRVCLSNNDVGGDPGTGEFFTGSLLTLGHPKGLRRLVPQPLVKPNEWFTLDVVAQGNRLQTFVNGTKAVDVVDAEKAFMKGPIALDTLDRDELHVRRIEIRELPTTPPTPAPAIARKPRFVREIDNKTQIRALAYSPDGKTLVAAGSDAVRFFDVRNGEELYKHEISGNVSGPISVGQDAVAFVLKGHVLVVDLINRKIVRDVDTGAAAEYSLALSPDARTVAYPENGGLRVLDLTTGKTSVDIAKRLFSGLGFTPDGRHVFGFGRKDYPNLAVLDAKTGQAVDEKPIGFAGLTSISRDGTRLAAVCARNDKPTFTVFDVRDGKLHERCVIELPTGGNSPSLSPDGGYFALSLLNGTVQIWDLARKENVLDPWAPHRSAAWVHTPVALAPDGKALATAADSTIKLWDLAPEKP